MDKLTHNHVRRLLTQDLREDKRNLLDYRKNISVEYGISPKSAEGSARVKIGDTEVVAGVKFDVGTPFPDKQDEGTIMVGTELLPLSNPQFESGPPSIDAIELARVVDRGIRESGALDFKKLCITKGQKVWLVFIDVYPINDAGNLFDAAALAALAALRDAKFPTYDAKQEKVLYDKRTTKKLPLTNTPIGVTVVKIGDRYLVDPTLEEWGNLDARLTVVSLEDGSICAMQKGGAVALTADDIDKMMTIALDKAKMLRKKL